MAQWLYLLITIFSSLALATTLVTQLSKGTWDDFIESHEVVVAVFCVPWYEPCNVLSPEFTTAAEILKDTPIEFIEVDCVKEVEHCSALRLSSYPTIRIYHGNSQWRSYRGKQKANSIAPYLLMNYGPQISVLGENNITTLTSFDTPVLVAHISTADEDSAKIFNEAASSLLKEEMFVFGTTASSKLAGIEDDFELPFVALYNPSDEAKPTYHGLFDPESIAKFALQAASTPLIGRFNLESLAAYADIGLSLALIFALTHEERQKFAHALKPLAEKHRGSLKFATVDASKLGFLAGELGLQPDQYPAFLIYDINSDGMYPFDQSREITRKSIESFIESFLSGRKFTGVEATLTAAEPKRPSHMHDEV